MYPNRVQILTMLNFVMLAYYRHSPPYATVTFRNIRRKLNFCASRNWDYVRPTIHVHRKEFNWNPYSNTVETDRPQHDRMRYRPTVFFRLLFNVL